MDKIYEIKGVPGKKYREDGSLMHIVTVEECIIVSFVQNVLSETGELRKKEGEQEMFLPLLLQSCMHPERFMLYPAEAEWKEFDGEEYVYLTSHTKQEKYKRKDIRISYEEYRPQIKRKGCIPCLNCGRC